jgi:S-DNA-T family DNA segregation ATPase FtsK/SpoIIIE
MGMCLSDFENKKEAMEQFFNASVDLKFDRNLVITVNTNSMKQFYKYETINYEEPLKFAIGYSRKGIYYIDMEDAIHILIGATTGGGKSVLLRSIITTLILTKNPDDLCIHLVDFMRVELGIFKRSSMINDFCYLPEQFYELLSRLTIENNMRLEMFERENIVNIKSWNKKHPNQKLKYHIIIVDEFASLMNKEYKHIKDLLMLRCAQDRKCGIHYIICTQRPSQQVINGDIKANLPSRICLNTASDSDSEIVLDKKGAEKLRGKGHALVKIGAEPIEIQTMFLDENEAQRLVQHTYVNKREEIKCENDTSGVIEI